MTVTPLTLPQLTEGGVSGAGVFDVLMQAMRAHLESEFTKNRIRGPEYSQVYLSSLQAVLQQATIFLLSKDKAAYEAELVAAQVELTKQQSANALIEGQNLVLQGELLAAQKENLDVERAFTQAKTAQAIQQTANAVIEGTVLTAQKCKLDAEYDLTLSNVTKSGTENSLLAQKVVTERAQTQTSGVDPDSVIGKQKNLYQAQTDGFKRDAEQKAAKLMADTWSSRRMTDEATVADGTNMLADVVVGRAINKMLQGVGA